MSSDNISRCKACGAQIIWIEDQHGKRVPLNKTRVRIYMDQGFGWHYLTTPKNDKASLYHISHFLTCPQANQFSGSGLAAKGGDNE